MSSQHSGAFTDLGKAEDLYYCDPDNTKVESIPVEYNTRFTQNLTNLSAGSSTFIIPPGNGLKHVILVIGFSAATVAAMAPGGVPGAALCQAWGYQAINQISFRIGGSSQYFMSGAQLLAKNLRQVRTQTQAQAILSLGGNQVALAGDYGAAAYAYIPIPVWCSPSNDGLSIPLPADTLAQQVQLTVSLNPPSSYITTNATVGTVVPTGLDQGYFQVEQLCMVDRGMAISNHVDLNTHELLMPIVFDQQELQIPVPAGSNGSGGVALTATGFRSGQVKAIQMWLTKNSDTINDNRWYAPTAVTVLYAGTIYSQYNDGSSVIWNLLDGTKPPVVTLSSLAAGVPFVQTAVSSSYALLPFGNPTGNDYEAEVLTHGKPILNGLVNIQLTAPSADAYTCHVVYIYNSTLVFSKSSAEFRF
jgi:hypothetical protein